MAKRSVCVIGVGMTKFERCDKDFTDLVKESGDRRARHGQCHPRRVRAGVRGLRERHELQGQRALYYMGLGGIPVYNVHSYCSTGSSALHLATRRSPPG